MPIDGPEELLVTIAPLAAVAHPGPADRPWLGPLLIVGAPAALAVVVFFAVLLLR
jgi:hypothetical protein